MGLVCEVGGWVGFKLEVLLFTGLHFKEFQSAAIRKIKK